MSSEYYWVECIGCGFEIEADCAQEFGWLIEGRFGVCMFCRTFPDEALGMKLVQDSIQSDTDDVKFSWILCRGCGDTYNASVMTDIGEPDGLVCPYCADYANRLAGS